MTLVSGFNEPNCVVILGTTASGKTRLAARLASYINGEIISADSRQVYRGLDIGAGKDFGEYTVNGQTIPVHLIDLYDPREQFFLHHFMKVLREAFNDITARRRVPVIAGGTGLYLDVLRKDFSFTLAPEDNELREELSHLGKNDLLLELQRLSPTMALGVDTSSRKRIIRGIEIARHFAQIGLPQPAAPLPYRPVYIGIKLSPAERRDRIAARLSARMSSGLVQEAEKLLESGVSHARLQRLGLEYRFLSLYLLGELTLDEMVRRLETAINRFAKRQMTWFRKMEREGVIINWVSGDEEVSGLAAEIETLLASSLQPGDSSGDSR